MNNTVIINSHEYTLIPHKTEDDLNRLRNLCGFGPGYCACGCGQRTKLAPTTVSSRGWVKGQPLKYVLGHNCRGPNHYRWQGGLHITTHDYAKLLVPSHPAADTHGHVLVSILVAEKALGKYLPRRAKVHHVDGDPLNNENSNLVVCQDQAYHMLLEKRSRAYKACGHADWLKCWICKEYDDPKNMDTRTPPGKTMSGEHKSCRALYNTR